jgi:hypothetical protein
VIADHDHLLRIGQVDPDQALVTGTRARSRTSLALGLRSPRDTPQPLATNVLLLRWDTKPAAHQEDVPTPGHDTQNAFLCRWSGDWLHRAWLVWCGYGGVGSVSEGPARKEPRVAGE